MGFRILRKPIVTCDFPGVGSIPSVAPLDPHQKHQHKHTNKTPKIMNELIKTFFYYTIIYFDILKGNQLSIVLAFIKVNFLETHRAVQDIHNHDFV